MARWAVGFGGHFLEGIWTEGIFLGGHLVLVGNWTEGYFRWAFGPGAFFWRATGTTPISILYTNWTQELSNFRDFGLLRLMIHFAQWSEKIIFQTTQQKKFLILNQNSLLL